MIANFLVSMVGRIDENRMNYEQEQNAATEIIPYNHKHGQEKGFGLHENRQKLYVKCYVP